MPRIGEEMVARGRVPDLHRPIVAGRNNKRAVGRPGYRFHLVRVVLIDGQGMLSGNVGLALDCRPDLGRSINAGGSDARVIWRPRDTPYLVDMTNIAEVMGAILRIPDLYGLIVSSRGDTRVISRPGQGTHVPGVTTIGIEAGAAFTCLLSIPDQHRRIRTRRGDIAAIGIPGHPGCRTPVAIISKGTVSSSPSPQMYRSIRPPGTDAFAIRGPRYRVHRQYMTVIGDENGSLWNRSCVWCRRWTRRW